MMVGMIIVKVTVSISVEAIANFVGTFKLSMILVLEGKLTLPVVLFEFILVDLGHFASLVIRVV